jgi:hypothetical protein
MSRGDDSAGAMAYAPVARPLRYLPRDVGQASWSSPSDWGEIDAAFLEGTRLAVPAFPLELLSPFWRDWVRDTAQSADAPIDYVALSLLAAVAGLGGAGAVVRIGPRWAEPLVLWQALVGAASSGKSPAMAPVRALLATIEAERAGGDKSSASVISDTALAAVLDAVTDRPRGVIVWGEDSAEWLAGAADARRASWLQAWSARPTSLGARRVERFAVSLLLAQPADRLAELLAAEALAARFLFAWPTPPAHCPLDASKPARDADALAALRRIAARIGRPDDPLELLVDKRGLSALDAFLAGLSAELRDAALQEREGLETAWLGKGRGTVARLAGVLELLAWSELGPSGPPGHIGAEQMERAVRLWSEYFRGHAQALFHRTVVGERERQARQVVRWLRQHGQSDVSREDIRVEALRRSINASDAEQVLYRLRDAGIVQRVDYRVPSGGGRPPNRWWVHPALITNESAGNAGNARKLPPK